MNPAQLLLELNDRKVAIVPDDQGQPVLDDPGHHLDEILLAEARRHRWLFAWHIEGERTGHTWAACDKCEEIALVRFTSSRTSRACLLTHGCTGRHRNTNTNTTNNKET